MQQNSEILKIKSADRHPIQNASDVVRELNATVSRCKNVTIKMYWSLGFDGVSEALHAHIKFQTPQQCIQFVQFVHDLQEAVDHHSSLTMQNFDTVEIMLSTHHPVPGITMVDVLFAQHLAAY